MTKQDLQKQIRDLEDQLFDICFQRNAAESRIAIMQSNFNKFKRQGLIDSDLYLEMNDGNARS